MQKKKGYPMNKIRLGTIGTGSIVHSILHAVQLTDGICPETVYSRNYEKGKALADTFGAGKVYTDLQDLLDDPEVNCIYIASPNNLHYEYAKLALENGKHVLCEKPMCAKASQVQELAELAEKKALCLIDATPTSYLPHFDTVKELLPKIGRIRLVMCNYSQYSSRYDQFRAALEDPERKGGIPNVFHPLFAGGSLMDINYYNVYFACALFGRPDDAVYYPNLAVIPEEWMAESGSDRIQTDYFFYNRIDTSGTMIMQYPDFVFEGAGTKDTWGRNYAQIEGEDGYLYVEGGTNGLPSVRLVTREGEKEYDLQDHPHIDGTNRYYYAVGKIAQLMLSGDKEQLKQRLNFVYDTISIIEDARKKAGIRFPGDDPLP